MIQIELLTTNPFITIIQIIMGDEAGNRGEPVTFKVKKPESLREDNLGRLNRMLSIRDDHWDTLNNAGKRLIDSAIVSAYLDCTRSGVSEDARRILEERVPSFLKQHVPEATDTKKQQSQGEQEEQGLGEVILEEE